MRRTNMEVAVTEERRERRLARVQEDINASDPAFLWQLVQELVTKMPMPFLDVLQGLEAVTPPPQRTVDALEWCFGVFFVFFFCKLVIICEIVLCEYYLFDILNFIRNMIANNSNKIVTIFFIYTII